MVSTTGRTVVEDAKCETCHDNLALHGDNRHDPEYCVTCHIPSGSEVDRRPDTELPVQSRHFKFLIHRIHRGKELSQEFTVYGFGNRPYDCHEVRFPGDLRDCETCHVNDSYTRAKIHYGEAGNPVRLIPTLLNITERKEAEMKLQKTQKELFNLSRYLIQAQEEERRRIARHLHDELGQDLALLSIEIERLMQKPPESQAQLAKGLQKLAMKNKGVSTYVQMLSRQLHLSSLEHLGLVAKSRG